MAASSYGFAVIVNPAFAAANPEAVTGFVRAVIGGTASHRQGAGRAPSSRWSDQMDGGSRELELERVRADAARQYPDRPRSGATGIGGIEPRGSRRSIDQIAERLQIPQAAGRRPSLRRQLSFRRSTVA